MEHKVPVNIITIVINSDMVKVPRTKFLLIYKNICDAIIPFQMYVYIYSSFENSSIQRYDALYNGKYLPLYPRHIPLYRSPTPLWQSEMSQISGLCKGDVGISDDTTSNYRIMKWQGCTWKRSWSN